MIHYFEEKIKGTGFFNAVYNKYSLIEFSTNKNLADEEIVKEFQEYFLKKNEDVIVFDCKKEKSLLILSTIELVSQLENTNIVLLNFESVVNNYGKEYYLENMRDSLIILAKIAQKQNNHIFVINKNQQYQENLNNLLVKNPDYLKEKLYCRIEIMDIDNKEHIEIF